MELPRFFGYTVAVLTIAMMSFRSDAGQQGSTTSTDKKTAIGSESSTKGKRRVTGCVSAENGKYSLSDAKGHTYTLESKENLSAHVGHEVAVRGTSSDDNKKMSVSDVQELSDSCRWGGPPTGKCPPCDKDEKR